MPEYRPDTACLNVILALTLCNSNDVLFCIQLASQENLSDAAGGWIGGGEMDTMYSLMFFNSM